MPLVKTSTHDLPAMLDKLISHLPSMKAAKMRSIADIKKHGKVGYDTAVKVAADAGQLRARAAAKAKGTTGKGAGTESAAGGQIAAAKWDELKKELLALGDQNFALPFNQRYLVLHVNKDTMVPTSASFAKLKEELKYVLPSLTLKLSCLEALPCTHLPHPTFTTRSHPLGEELTKELESYEDEDMSDYLDSGDYFTASPWGEKDAQEARERSDEVPVPMEPLDDGAPPPEPAVAVDEPAVAVALDEPVAVKPADEPAGEPAGVPAALRPRPPKATTPAAGTVPAAAVDLTAGGNRKRNRQSRAGTGTGAPKGRPRADAADKAADKADKAAVSKLQQDSKLLREENARLARGALLGVHLNYI